MLNNNHMKRFLIAIIFSVLNITVLQAQSLPEIWSTDKIFDIPESVYYYAGGDLLFVSNIGGNPTAKDSNGFISILGTDGKLINLKFAEGLNAPKGITVYNNNLYVTDIDNVTVIDLKTGRIKNKIPCPDASFLNDITNDDKGNLYVSDTQKDIIYKITGTKAEKWIYDNNLLKAPNGMAFLKGKIFVGTVNGIAEFDTGNKNFKIIIQHEGMIDGLIPLNEGSFIVSDWKGKTELLRNSKETVLLNTTSEGINAADLGFIPEKNMLLIPTFSDDRVIAYIIKFP